MVGSKVALLVIALHFVLTGTSAGQSINIDVGDTAGVPPPSYAAAGLPGFWNALGDSPTCPALLDVHSKPTTVTISPCRVSWPAHDWPEVCGPEQPLLEDFVGLGDISSSWTISGLRPGEYRFIIYGWTPSSTTYVFFWPTDAEPPDALIGGPWPGSLTAGITHSEHRVATNGFIGLTAFGDFGTGGAINGFQLVYLDCNDNGVSDVSDIASGFSGDCNENGLPDECERNEDCNENKVQDICEVSAGTSSDCNRDLVPDECESSNDCDNDGEADLCAIASCKIGDCNENSIPDNCEEDCNSNEVADECEIEDGRGRDCNGNMQLDECDLQQGESVDDDANTVPDECQDLISVPDDYLTIQEAIDAADHGDTVIVSDGTYRGVGNKNLSTRGKILTVRSKDGPDQCIIDCENSGRAFKIDKRESSLTRIDGFTLKYCRNAIWTIDSSPIISNCIVENSSYGQCGAAVDFLRGSPSLEDSVIRNSTGDLNDDNAGGGGVYCLASDCTITRCQIVNNTGSRCGGIRFYAATGSVVDSVIAGNSTVEGGGIQCDLESAVTLSRTILSGNTADKDGGGIHCDRASLVIENCLLADNSAGHRGGAIYGNDCTVSILSSTVVNNSADGAGAFFGSGTGNVNLSNSILYDNGLPSILGPVSVHYSNVEGGFPGVGNMGLDPEFETGFALASNSPCINNGDPAAGGSLGFDLAGNVRIVGCRIDMGAFESNKVPAPHDFDASDTIDLKDLSGFQLCIGSVDEDWRSACLCTFDSDSNETIDLQDFADFVAQMP